METRDSLLQYTSNFKSKANGRSREKKSKHDKKQQRRQQRNKGKENNIKMSNGKHNFKCYRCGKRVHYAADCYTNTSKDNQQQQQQYTVLTAADIHVITETSWYLDSGATAHMCCSETFFVNMKKYK